MSGKRQVPASCPQKRCHLFTTTRLNLLRKSYRRITVYCLLEYLVRKFPLCVYVCVLHVCECLRVSVFACTRASVCESVCTYECMFVCMSVGDVYLRHV